MGCKHRYKPTESLLWYKQLPPLVQTNRKPVVVQTVTPSGTNQQKAYCGSNSCPLRYKPTESLLWYKQLPPLQYKPTESLLWVKRQIILRVIKGVSRQRGHQALWYMGLHTRSSVREPMVTLPVETETQSNGRSSSPQNPIRGNCNTWKLSVATFMPG